MSNTICLCDYGCGQLSVFVLKNGKRCCNEKYQKCPALKAKNSQGLQKVHSEGRGFTFNDACRIKAYKSKKQNVISDFLTNGSTASNMVVKNRLKDLGIPQCCAVCSLSQWRGKDLSLELDHINGNNRDNRIENLRLLCPNCHSQTETWRGKNINSGLRKVTDNDILTAFDKTANIRQSLIEVGLAPKGGNYSRVKKLLRGRGETGDTRET